MQENFEEFLSSVTGKIEKAHKAKLEEIINHFNSK